MKTQIKRLIATLGRWAPVAAFVRRPSIRRWVQRLPAAHLLYHAGWTRLHPFDRVNGTDTSGAVPVSDLLLGEAASAHALCYAGSQPSIVRRSLAALPPLDGFTFVDLGCGKGRALVVATEFPFADIVGVELSSALVGVARANAAVVSRNFPNRTRIRVVESDALGHEMPAGNIVLYLYNPFGEAVVAEVVRALEQAMASASRRVYVVYYNAVAGHCFDASLALRRHSARQLSYAAEERGFGPDDFDTVVIWQDRGQAASDASAEARLVVDPGRLRVSLA